MLLQPWKAGPDVDVSPDDEAADGALVPPTSAAFESILNSTPPPSWWGIEDEATVRALRQLQADAKSKRCVCGAAKWEWYPFCRRCSLRLVRAGHFYKQSLGVCRGFQNGNDHPTNWRRYDSARDFILSCKVQKRRRKDPDECEL